MPFLSATRHILLADDDKDDCALFKDTLADLPFPIEFATVNNGEKLMELLKEKNTRLPDVLFLDLNMPRKNGFDCLLEIKTDAVLKQMPVVIITTSAAPDVINTLYASGAHYYIRKPNTFEQFRNSILEALKLTAESGFLARSRDKFVLS